MKNTYQRMSGKSKHNFEIVGSKELAVRLPLPLVEVWEQLQPQVEPLAERHGIDERPGRIVIFNRWPKRYGGPENAGR